MSSRLFKHNWWVPWCSHLLWLNSSFPWFSWFQIICFWHNGYPPPTGSIFYFNEPSNSSQQPHIVICYFIIFSRIHQLNRYNTSTKSRPSTRPGHILWPSLFWTVIIYTSTNYTRRKHLYPTHCSVTRFIFNCLGCLEFWQQQSCYFLGCSSGR